MDSGFQYRGVAAVSGTKRRFGPFLDVSAEDIKSAGFICYGCRRPVEKLAKALPLMVPRLIFYACQCGTIVVWEDETKPRGSRHWRMNTKLLKSAGVQMIIFNGNRPLAPAFSGI